MLDQRGPSPTGTRARLIALVLALGLTPAPLGADGQQSPKIPRIGILANSSPSYGASLVEAFRQGLLTIGYNDVVIEARSADGRFERLPDLAAELVRLKVDVIVSAGTAGPLAAKHATSTIPIVMIGAGDPVASGLVASLARPGGNVAGTSMTAPELGGKRLQLLKEAVPSLSRVAVAWNPLNPDSSFPHPPHAPTRARSEGDPTLDRGVADAGEHRRFLRDRGRA